MFLKISPPNKYASNVKKEINVDGMGTPNYMGGVCADEMCILTVISMLQSISLIKDYKSQDMLQLKIQII